MLLVFVWQEELVIKFIITPFTFQETIPIQGPLLQVQRLL